MNIKKSSKKSKRLLIFLSGSYVRVQSQIQLLRQRLVVLLIVYIGIATDSFLAEGSFVHLF